MTDLVDCDMGIAIMVNHKHVIMVNHKHAFVSLHG